MKKTIIKTSILGMFLMLVSGALAQTPDAEGCKDSPFFNRLEKFYIYGCIENYDAYEFVTADGEHKTIEGNLLEIIYSYDGEYGPNLPSKLQVIRNYENAIKKMGGKKIYSKTTDDGDWTGATFQFKKDDAEYWLGIYDLINNPVDQYTFVLLKIEGMNQEITANELFEAIDAGESMALYINFETGKWDIKNDSQSIVDELHKMLVNNPTLKIIIEGHTDNVGDALTNKVLSENRAMSLKQALIDKGIETKRIQDEGYGQDKPIADNSTDEGKAKNRRVEIKKVEDTL